MQNDSEHLSPIGLYRLAAGNTCESAGLSLEALEANVVADLLAACGHIEWLLSQAAVPFPLPLVLKNALEKARS